MSHARQGVQLESSSRPTVREAVQVGEEAPRSMAVGEALPKSKLPQDLLLGGREGRGGPGAGGEPSALSKGFPRTEQGDSSHLLCSGPHCTIRRTRGHHQQHQEKPVSLKGCKARGTGSVLGEGGALVGSLGGH